jgi:hypothetical protein
MGNPHIIEKVMVTASVMLVIALVVLIPLSIKQNVDFEEACKEAGGISYTSPKSYNLCLNPTAIVELK